MRPIRPYRRGVQLVVPLHDHSGGLRLDLPPSHPDFRQQDSPDMMDIVVLNGVNRAFPGCTRYTTAEMGVTAPQAIRFLSDFKIASGGRYLVAVDAAGDIWKFVPGTPDTWVCLTPVYTAGTAAFEHGSIYVTGLNTVWTSEMEGKPIRFDADGWLEGVVASVTSPTSLELAEAYSGAGAVEKGAYTIRQTFTPGATPRTRGAVGDNKLILVNGTDLPFWWDGTAATFTLMSGAPYTTGTATFTHDSFEVDGTDTLWTSALKGRLIKLDADGQPTNQRIAEVVSATHLHLTAPYNLTGGSGAYTIEGSDPPRAYFVTTFHHQNLLVMAAMSTDGQRLQHSDADNYQEWGEGFAHFYDFHNMAGNITGLDGGHEYVFLFFERGIYRGSWMGTDIAIGWEAVGSTDGPIVPSSLVRLGGQAKTAQEAPVTMWAYWGERNIFAFDGTSVVTIGDPIRDWIWSEDGLDPNYTDQVQATVIPGWRWAIWSFPVKGSAGRCARTVVYDYAHQRWFRRNAGWDCLGDWDLSMADEEWDSQLGAAGALDDLIRVFDRLGTTPDSVTLGARGTRLYYLTLGVNDVEAPGNGLKVSPARRTATFEPYKGKASEVGIVSLLTEAAPGDSVLVQLWGGDNPHQLHRLGRPQYGAVLEDGEVRVGFRAAARWFALEIAGGRSRTRAQSDPRFYAATVYAWPRGN